MKKIIICVHLFLISCVMLCFGQENQENLILPVEEIYTDWRARIDSAILDKVAEMGFAISNEAFKQIFVPYTEPEGPVFITTDSILNGFHVLLEESIMNLEINNSQILPAMLRYIWKNLLVIDKDLKLDPQLVKNAKKRALIIIGVALKLLGDETPGIDKKIGKIIDREVKRIHEAKDKMKPGWLGPPDNGFLALDYSVFKPRGFYYRLEPLQKYFRALKWLQTIPFRISKDEEFLSILMLGNCIVRDYLGSELGFIAMLKVFKQFLGTGDDLDLSIAVIESQNLSSDKNLEEKRKDILLKISNYGEGPQINDRICFAPGELGTIYEANFRIISAYRIPDAVLFQRTTDPRKVSRNFPTGLELGTALGSSFARSLLSTKENKEILKIIDNSKDIFSGKSINFKYLHCLRALLDEPEQDAPAFMKSRSWEIKSCNTALAGWSQMRHTWALQAKEDVMYAGICEVPPGFIEPEPEFFSKLANLVEEIHFLLKKAGAFETNIQFIEWEIHRFINLLEVLLKEKSLENGNWFAEVEKFSPEDRQFFESKYEKWICQLSSPLSTFPGRTRREVFTDAIKQFKNFLTIKEPYIKKSTPIYRYINEDLERIDDLWRILTSVCRRLEALSHKQLRGLDFNEEEKDFIRSYGEKLAHIMLYDGNSYYQPKDDAPRVIDIFYNSNLNRYLEVGVCRPRAIYVDYPTRKGKVLCKGAVMLYYEFPHPSRLTDREWQMLLDSPQRPKILEWLCPLFPEGSIKTRFKD